MWTRRRALRAAGALGVVGAAGLAGRHWLLPPGPSAELADHDELARRLVDSFDAPTRARALVDYDHPLRQLHNIGLPAAGVPIGPRSFDREQRRILTDLVQVGLSGAGRARLPEQYFLAWLGVHAMNVLVCGDPREGPCQVVLSGPHVNLRPGGANREGVAFGGPQVYGDQRGNRRDGLPGNRYRYQLEAATRLFASLSGSEQEAATLPGEPLQTRLDLQGPGGDFEGVPIRALSAESRRLAAELVRGMLSTWAGDDVAYAEECLEENGGVEALSVAWYEGTEGRGANQLFRMEGPGAILYFHGYPHVHAFVHVTREPENRWSVGAELGENPTRLEGEGVRRLFERAMRAHTGADLAWFDPHSVAGRLPAGPVRAGDVYVLECWQESVVTIEARADELGPELLERLREGRAEPDPSSVLRIATTGGALRERGRELVGRTLARETGPLLREVTVDYLERHPLGS